MEGADDGWLPFKPTHDYRDYLASVGFFFLMCYIFIGIAIASDVFMNAIEKICGATRTVKISTEEDGVVVVYKRETQIWNETVANLSLMALGSSAPEILLSAIEVSVGLGHHNPGDLGPGTIVGSAAFNLMIISAVCILSLPKNATSRIKLYKVFVVTSIISLLAYMWMVVVLVWVSPDVVDLWEALVTLFFFPLLIVISYWADQDFCVGGRKKRRSTFQSQAHVTVSNSTGVGDRDFYFGDPDADNLYDDEGNYDKNALMHLYNKLQEFSTDLKTEEIVSILATKLIQGKQHNRTWYRTKAAKALMGGGSMVPVLDEKLKEVIEILDDNGQKSIAAPALRGSITNPNIGKMKAIVEFQAATLAVAEGIGEFQVVVNRSGREDLAFQVVVNSADGTAKKDKEYCNVSELLMFDPYVNERTVSVSIIDNVQWNPDSNFYLRLSIPPDYALQATLGKMRVVEIIIEDDDKPGVLSFEKHGYVFKDSQKSGHIAVSRTSGTDGIVSVTWKVIPGPNCTLVPEDCTDSLEFQHKEMKKFIEIPFLGHNGRVEGHDETFEVVLSDPQGGVSLGQITRLTCAVSSDENFKLEINNAVTAALKMCEEAEDDDVSYRDQILNAIFVNGGDTANATCRDWTIHISIFPLKLLCALIPPPGLCGGWLCFFCALVVVGFLTKLVGDTASNFGEALGMDPTITAMTFVALGTSLPDTFASQIAAKHDKTADNAIGNVTGSNSVNVFLGLGVPWTIGAIFYMLFEKDKNPVGFCVPAGSLYFNVMVFSVCAAVSVAILMFRRYSKACGNAELGGPDTPKWISAVLMIILWVVYIAASSVDAQNQRINALNSTQMRNRNGNTTLYTKCAIKVKECRESLANCSL